MNKTAGVWTKRHEKAIDKWLAAHPDHTDHMRWSEMPTELVDTLISIRNGDMMPAFAESYFRKQIDARRHGKVWGRSASAGMDNKRIAKELLKIARTASTRKTASTFKYEGDTALDMVYAMTDFMHAVQRKLATLDDQPWSGMRTEITAVRNAILALEKPVRALQEKHGIHE